MGSNPTLSARNGPVVTCAACDCLTAVSATVARVARRPSPETVVRALTSFITDPRAVGVAQAGPRTVLFMVRSWSRTRSNEGPDEPVWPSASLGLALQVLLDEVVLSAMRNPRLLPSPDDYVRAGNEIRAAWELWRREGWLDNPHAYHRNPPVPEQWRISRERSFDQRYEHLSYLSEYDLHPGEPGRERWLGHESNRTAHAYVLRHAQPGRPWLVCVHGFGMGKPALDLRAFRAARLHWELGVNLLFSVLPLHGVRQDPAVGEGLMSINLMDSLHGLAQAACDVRAAVRWIRATAGDVPVGVHGISLGGYVAALVASLEDDLACAIAGIPATDMPDLYRRHSSPGVRRQAAAAGALGPEADAVHSVVSPLVLSPRLPKGRRYIYAGTGDRMSTSNHARRLWDHWERPTMAWYPGGHIGFWWAGTVADFVASALAESGLTEPRRSEAVG